MLVLCLLCLFSCRVLASKSSCGNDWERTAIAVAPVILSGVFNHYAHSNWSTSKKVAVSASSFIGSSAGAWAAKGVEAEGVERFVNNFILKGKSGHGGWIMALINGENPSRRLIPTLDNPSAVAGYVGGGILMYILMPKIWEFSFYGLSASKKAISYQMGKSQDSPKKSEYIAAGAFGATIVSLIVLTSKAVRTIS